ncbi:MAG: EAL domain-containing protein [Zoogloeaceae bacterium]|jgi:lactose/cellobiose-specific phosphotransferase system IIC component|nr:EAL domain-containing protein [Zoogloeaceae bacterium]
MTTSGQRLFDRIYTLTAPNWAFSPTMLAIRNGFLLCLPLVVAGVLAILINNLPFPDYQDNMARLFGPNWSKIGDLVWQGVFGILSLPLLVGISYHLATLYNQRYLANPVSPVITALVALASLMIIMPAGNVTQQLGTQGLFVSMVVAILSARIFLYLARIKQLQMLIYAEGMEASILQAFACLLPGIITVFLFAVFAFAFSALTGLSVHQYVHDLAMYPFRFFQSTLDTGITYVFITHVFWFFGIHGANVLDPMTRDIFESAANSNLAAQAAGTPPPYVVTKLFLNTFVFMGGSGSSICLLAALLITNRKDGSRRLAKISLAPGLFNINEVLLFGLPVILNPVFLLPFVLTPLALTLTSFVAVHYGLAPGASVAIIWTTPPLLSGYFATGGALAGTLLQCFNLALGTLIYIPFVKIFDRLRMERQKKAMNALMDIACNNIVGPSGKKCLDRGDEVGVLARVLAGDLERALKRGKGLYLEYQPQVDHISGKVIGAEALARWRHPEYGLIPAPIMVAISEDGDFMQPLGLWVLNEACAGRARWQQHGLEDDFKTSVNVSIRQLGDTALPDKVIRCLERHHLQRHMIGIEVTESIALDPDAPHNRILNQIHDLGIVISIDDFGMGHSSLAYLKYFPVNTLKIDKVLSEDVATSRTCVEIITTIVELCRALDVKIVVEFVENQEQIDTLCKLGCHIFQGYFYSPPLSGENMLAYALAMNAAPQTETA